MDSPHETVVLADKGYCSWKNRDGIRQRGLRDGIMHWADMNLPLSEESKARNHLISRLRYAVEQEFGTLKRRYHFERARYVGRHQPEMKFHLNAIAFDIRNASRMLA